MDEVTEERIVNETWPETTAAWRKVKRNLRILLCEWLIAKALDIAPEGYVPAALEAVARRMAVQLTTDI